MNLDPCTPLAAGDFARVLSASGAVLDAQLATAKARRALEEIIREITAASADARAEDRADEQALAVLRAHAADAERNADLLDHLELGTPMPPPPARTFPVSTEGRVMTAFGFPRLLTVADSAAESVSALIVPR